MLGVLWGCGGKFAWTTVSITLVAKNLCPSSHLLQHWVGFLGPSDQIQYMG